MPTKFKQNIPIPFKIEDLRSNVHLVGKMNYYASKLLPVTYAQLKQLRDTNMLVPGQQYRITNYKTTTTTTNTSSSIHYFDVIVTADSTNKLNEEAKATQSARDTANYFTNCNLNAWKI